MNLFEWRIDRCVAIHAAVGLHCRHLARRAFRQSEVEQEQFSLIGNLQIRRLDVTMQNRRLAGVQILEQLQYLIGPTYNLLLRKRITAQIEQGGEVMSGNVFHHQELAIPFAKIIHHFRQRGMTQVSQQCRFALKRFAGLRVCPQQRLFQRYDAAHPSIDRFVNSAHPAGAKLTHDPITVLQN